MITSRKHSTISENPLGVKSDYKLIFFHQIFENTNPTKCRPKIQEVTLVVSSVKLCNLVLTSTFFAFQFSYRPFFRMCFILFDFFYGKGRCFSFINLNVSFYQFFFKI